MKILTTTLFLIIINFTGAFGQTNQITPCPTISVSGPSFIPTSGKPITFTAAVSEESKMFDIKFIWTVIRGEIIEGQGTSTIKTTWENPENSVMATVEIKGLPANCGNTASEIMHYEPVRQPEKVDEIFLDDKKLFEDKYNKLIDALKDAPSAQLYVIFYFKKKSLQKSIDKKMRQIENYLVNVNEIDKERITTVKAFSEKQEAV